jgi:hypothetical protein
MYFPFANSVLVAKCAPVLARQANWLLARIAKFEKGVFLAWKQP